MVEESKIKEQEEINKVIKARENLEMAVASIPETNKDIKEIKDQYIKECNTVECIMKKVEELEKRLDDKKVVCDNCGERGPEVFDSFCPHCGEPIEEWNDEKGYPIDPRWTPAWKRQIQLEGREEIEKSKENT